MKLGYFEIWALSDGTFALDGGQVFGVVPRVLWEKKLAADSLNRVRLALTCLLVRTGKHNVIIETGIGDKYDRKFAEIYGIEKTTTLLTELARHGLGTDDIDIVINTHLHFDHCGWNTCSEGLRIVPTFSRARYFVQQGEWEHALSPTERDRASYIEECFRAAEPQTDFLHGGAEIIPGIRVEVVPGHTEDMQCVWVESQGQRACFVSDLIPTLAHLPYPWIMSLDLYPLRTLASRKRLVPLLAREGVLAVFPHDVSTPWCRLVESGGRIMPTEESTSVTDDTERTRDRLGNLRN